MRLARRIGLSGRSGQEKTTVLRPWTRTRCSRWARTARASTIVSRSRPRAVRRRDVVAVRDVHGVLLDDRALVEVGGRVVRGRADELDAAVVGLAVRVGADERRQERVVDVDDPVRVRSTNRSLRICM